jgi:hypothetical protein
MTTKPLADERGAAMVLELLLLALVVAALGYAGYQYFHHASVAATPAAQTGSNADISVPNEPNTPTGISAGVSAIANNLANSDTAAADQASGEDQSSANNNSTAATSVGGAYNASSF